MISPVLGFGAASQRTGASFAHFCTALSIRATVIPRQLRDFDAG
jgi:hypothetical protein